MRWNETAPKRGEARRGGGPAGLEWDGAVSQAETRPYVTLLVQAWCFPESCPGWLASYQ